MCLTIVSSVLSAPQKWQNLDISLYFAYVYTHSYKFENSANQGNVSTVREKQLTEFRTNSVTHWHIVLQLSTNAEKLFF